MPPKGLAATLARAKTAGTRLQQSTEVLNSGLRAVEKTLVELKLGVRGGVPLRLPGDGLDAPHRRLTFGKFSNEWCLAVETADSNEIVPDEDEWEWQPLLNCNRETRIAAIDVLPELVSILADRTEKDAAELDTKTQQLAEFVTEIGADEDLPF
jgi:hypothetical protein